MSYQFIDGYGSVLTADSSIISGSGVSGVIRPIVNVGSIGGINIVGSVALGGGQTSVSGVGIFNVNHIGNGSIQTVSLGSIATAPQPGSVSGVGLFNVNQVGNGSILVLVPGSVATAPSPASVSGVGQFNVNHNGNGSVLTVSLGSIATAPFPASVSGVGQFNVNPTGNGSVIATNQVTRNDAVASFLGADLTPRYMAGDSAGRVLVKPFAPEEARVQSVISATAGTTSFLAAAGAGLRTYITDAFVTNTSSTATIVSFLDGDNSVMGRTIAPATGGSNIHTATPMRTGGFNQIVQVQMATITSTLGVTALGYKAP